MKKIDLGQAINSLANVMVIVGILFLIVEIRQNTLATQATGMQLVTSLSREQLLTLSSDPEIARIDRIGNTNPSALTPEEQHRYIYLTRSFWLGMQVNYRSWVLGILPEEEWAYYSRVICANVNLPGTYARFQAEREMFIPAFAEFVDSCNSGRAD